MDYSRLAEVPTIKAQLKELERRRGIDPDIPTGMLGMPKIYVAYEWRERPTREHPDGHWCLLGFVMARSLQLPRVAEIRRRFKVNEDAIMKLMDLMLAAKLGGPGDPPSQYNPIVDRGWLHPDLRRRA